MPTAEQIGDALESGAIRQMITDSPYDGLRSDSPLNEVQLNERIMKPEWESNKLYLMKPKLVSEEAYVVMCDENENPQQHKGIPVVKLKRVNVFKGWEKKEVEIPGGNVFKTDLTTAISSEEDLNILRKMLNLYFYLVELSMATGEDYSYDLYKFHALIGGMLNISKSRYGKTMEMLKTQITRGYQENTLKQMLLSDRKKKGLFARFKRR